MTKKVDGDKHYCYDCTYAEPNDSQYAYSITGAKILGNCPYEDFAVLLSLPCPNKHFKPKKP